MAGIVIPLETYKARKELDLLQREFVETGKTASKAEKETKKLERHLNKGLGARKASRGLDMLNRGIKATARGMFSLQGMIAGFTFAGMTAGMVALGATFQKEMETVRGVTRATDEQFAALTAQARKMGATTEWTASQSAGALRFLGMAGFEATQAVAALPGTLDLATAGNLELSRAADIASNALTAMQLEVSELGRINDVFISTMTRSNVDMEMLAESFKYSAPLARALGYDVEELSAMIGVLGNAGIQGSMAGTQLAFAMQQLPKLWKELGMSGEGKNLIDALEAINAAGWQSEQVMKVFGQRGGRAVLVLKDMIPQYNKLAQANRDAEGAAKALADRIRDTVIGDFKTLKSTIEDIAIETFTTYEKEIRGMLQGTTQYLREHKDEIMSTMMAFGELLQAITLAIGKMAQWTGVFVKGISTMGRALGKFAADKDLGWKDMMLMVTNPAAFVAKMTTAQGGEGEINIQDFFTGKAGEKLFDWEDAMRKQAEQVEQSWDKIKKERGWGEYAKKKEAEIEAVTGKAPAAAGIPAMSEEQRREQQRVLEDWYRLRDTYRLDDTEKQLYDLKEQYDYYAQHVKDIAALDQWYKDEQERIRLAQMAELESHQIYELNQIKDQWMLRDEGMKQAAERADQMKEQTGSLFTDIDEKMKSFGQTYQNQFANAFVDFFNKTKTARQAFADFSRSVVNNLLEMIAKQLIFNSLSTAFGGGIGGGGGLLGAIFGGARAMGGDVSPGKSYWVGERGPEKFTPNQKGTITPAQAQPETKVSIANIIDPTMMEDWATSESGQNSIMNVVKGNSETLKYAMR